MKADVTTVEPGTQGTSGTAVVAPERPAPPAPAPGRPSRLRPERALAATLAFTLLFVVGFFVYLYGLSYLSESHAQTATFKNFVYQLDQATAPIHASKEGTPMAVLSIPAIGLKDLVVVEGTASRDLALGPGHLASTPLPGQTGTSTIYGKMATFGAPFAHLMRLNRGDKITVATGQGISTYTVESFGTTKNQAPADSSNRLVLVTAASSFLPNSGVEVSADLTSSPLSSPGVLPAVPQQDDAMARDTADALIPLLLWSQALLLAVIIAVFGTHRWSRWPTYLVMTPVIVALTWCVYQNLAACLLPNLY